MKDNKRTTSKLLIFLIILTLVFTQGSFAFADTEVYAAEEEGITEEFISEDLLAAEEPLEEFSEEPSEEDFEEELTEEPEEYMAEEVSEEIPAEVIDETSDAGIEEDQAEVTVNVKPSAPEVAEVKEASESAKPENDDPVSSGV